MQRPRPDCLQFDGECGNLNDANPLNETSLLILLLF